MGNMNDFAYRKFTKEVADGIRDYLPEEFIGAKVDIRTVEKNNNRKYAALTVRHADRNIAPVVYLDPYYERYEVDKDMGMVLSDIAKVIASHDPAESFDMAQIMDFDRVKDRIIPRLVGQKWNKDMLAATPNTPVADLAVTYHVVLDGFTEGYASVPVSYEMLGVWGKDVSEIHALSIQNMHMRTPSTYQPLGEVLGSCVPDGKDAGMPDVSDVGNLMYVLTNESKLHGAAAVLDPNMAETVAASFGGNFYLLPSSVHEWLVVPADGADTAELAAMVREVNDTQVADEDVLSDHAYRFTVAEGLVAA